MRTASESNVSEIDDVTYASSTELMARPDRAAADDGVVQLRILPRADAGFVTHLMSVQSSPQSRAQRRATSADALAAYHNTANRSDRPAELARVTRRNA